MNVADKTIRAHPCPAVGRCARQYQGSHEAWSVVYNGEHEGRGADEMFEERPAERRRRRQQERRHELHRLWRGK